MSTLVPPPIRTPIELQNGSMHPVWERWFLSLFKRVGGTIAADSSDIETVLAMAAAESPRVVTDDSGAFDAIASRSGFEEKDDSGAFDIPSRSAEIAEDYAVTASQSAPRNEDYQPLQIVQAYESVEQAFPTHENSHSGWKDQLADISAGRAIGVNAPTWTALNGGIYGYAFSAATMNEIWVNIHIPHDYEWGTPIYPHIHWTTTGTNTGVCRWGVEYTFARAYGIQSFPATSTIYIEQAASGVALRHMVAEPAEGSGIVLANCEPDGVLMCRFFRDAANANDTLTDAAFGIFADMHYMSDGFLTNERNRTFTKRRD